VHTRIPFDLTSPQGVADYRSFLERAADLVVAYGGSLSGEHGDGQQRGELLPKMFGAELIAAFERYKAIFDPDHRMNPGMITRPLRLDQDLRLGADYHQIAGDTQFSYPRDAGDFASAVLRCVGVGECRRTSGGLMCPSYQVTRDEEHSTRGRARLLFEMLDGAARGGAIGDGWRSTAVRDALDLCLACKGCKSECPVNVDLATYKAEFLSHHYARRLRPRDHYSMGWLPAWAALAALAPRTVNAVTHAPGLRGVVKAFAGVDPRREVPRFATRTFQRWFRDHTASANGSRGEVLLWPDTFTNHFDPAVGIAAVGVLEAAGWRVRVPMGKLCCGLTWISTGQLAPARRALRRTVAALREHLRAGGLVVGLEPSCVAVFRDDAERLLPRDEDVARLASQTFTLGELLWDHTPGWRPPAITGRVLVQRHCHQQAVLGYAADAALLRATGATVRILDSGCCGLAGNFGFTRGHYDVSMACAERALFPEVRAAESDDVVLADGFSCRTQLAQGNLGGRRGTHLSQLLGDERPRQNP
jgi:Fe-S oxidoreductase